MTEILTEERKQTLLYEAEKGLESNFSLFSWEELLETVADASGWSKEDLEWAKRNITYAVLFV